MKFITIKCLILKIKNIIDGVEETFDKWQPRHDFEFIPVEPLKQPKYFVKHVIAK